MKDWHVSEGLLDRFLRAEVSKDEARQVVRHLLSGCSRCSERAHRVASETGLFRSGEVGRSVGWEQAYEEVFTRTLAFVSQEEQQLALERLQGWAQWAFLEPFDPERRFVIVESDRNFHTVGFLHRLLEASRWYYRTDPAEAVDIMNLGLLVAERLDESRIRKKGKADLRASAWAALGNARRIAEDFEGARQAFNEAWRILEEEGTGDPIEQASIISLEASYMKDIGEFELAESSLEEALDLYRRAGDSHRQGRVLLKMGEIIGHVNPERGIAHIEKALALLDLAREPRLDLCAQHALAGFLAEAGRPDEALAVLERARPLYEQFRDNLTQLRLHWVEGKIAHRLGNLSEAESIFAQLWDEFHARNLHQEVVLVSIELAEIFTQKGEPARGADLAAQCYSIMQSWGMRQDALAAWIVFLDALAHGKAQDDLFARAQRFYRRHWARPGSFEG